MPRDRVLLRVLDVLHARLKPNATLFDKSHPWLTLTLLLVAHTSVSLASRPGRLTQSVTGREHALTVMYTLLMRASAPPGNTSMIHTSTVAGMRGRSPRSALSLAPFFRRRGGSVNDFLIHLTRTQQPGAGKPAVNRYLKRFVHPALPQALLRHARWQAQRSAACSGAAAKGVLHLQLPAIH